MGQFITQITMLYIVMPPAFHKGTFQQVKVKNRKKIKQQKSTLG